MKKLAIVVMLSLCVTSCAHCPPGGTTTKYDIARSVIQGAQLSLFVADGIFEQWALAQTDQEKVKQARIKYNHIRTLVADGLKIALDAMAIAEQAQVDPDITKIMAQADKAWQDIRSFLTDLLGKTPSSLPAKVAAEKVFTIADLPLSLIPPKK